MGRRCLGLLAALALLVVPSTASAAAAHAQTDDHAPARVTVADRHTNAAHVVARPSSGRDRRSPHHSSSSSAVLGAGADVALRASRADVLSATTSATHDLPSSSRPRAPPAVV
jgi:hypothetical protein